jgi:hypothetical protein
MGDVEPPLSEEFLDIAISQRDTQVEPDRMLDDHRRKAMSAVGDFDQRTSRPTASPPDYPVKLTKPSAVLSPSRRRVHPQRVELNRTPQNAAVSVSASTHVRLGSCVTSAV